MRENIPTFHFHQWVSLAHIDPPAGGNLKVRQADKYGWEPRKLLEQLVDIYLHLDSPKFHQAIANDEVGVHIEKRSHMLYLLS